MYRRFQDLKEFCGPLECESDAKRPRLEGAGVDASRIGRPCRDGGGIVLVFMCSSCREQKPLKGSTMGTTIPLLGKS